MCSAHHTWQVKGYIKKINCLDMPNKSINIINNNNLYKSSVIVFETKSNLLSTMLAFII